MAHTGRVRNMVTDEQIYNAVEEAGGNYAAAARDLSDQLNRHIDRALVNYWHRQLVVDEETEEVKRTPARERAERVVAAARASAPPRPSILDPKRESLFDTECVIHFTDLHAPYHHPDSMDFLYAVKQKYQPTLAINGGDEVDNHALSMHDSDPNLNSAGPELAESRKVMRDLESIFPDQEVLDSNHGSLHYRRGKKYAIPVEYLRSYREILFPNRTVNWNWSDEVKIVLPNGSKVLFKHGLGCSNLLSRAGHEGCSMAAGHFHSRFGIEWAASSERLYFAMFSGCLIDQKALAFAYGRDTPARPILGCGIIVDSTPRLIPMVLNKNGAWDGRVA